MKILTSPGLAAARIRIRGQIVEPGVDGKYCPFVDDFCPRLQHLYFARSEFPIPSRQLDGLVRVCVRELLNAHLQLKQSAHRQSTENAADSRLRTSRSSNAIGVMLPSARSLKISTNGLAETKVSRTRGVGVQVTASPSGASRSRKSSKYSTEYKLPL